MIHWGRLLLGLFFLGMAAWRWGTSPGFDVLLLLVAGWNIGSFFDSLDEAIRRR